MVAAYPVYVATNLFMTYAVNIPHWDDHAIKVFVLYFEKADSIFDKLKLLFKLHNEHRIVTTRLAALALVFFEGTLNFKHLMLVGNASLLGLLVYFILAIKNYQISWAYVAVASFLLFNLSTAENFYWGMASVQNFGVIFFAFSSFYFLAFDFTGDAIIEKEYVFTATGKQKNILSYLNIWAINTFRLIHIRYYLAATMAIFAVFTSGNGIIVPIIGFLALLFLGYYRKAFFWFLSVGFILFLYFKFNQTRPDAVNDTAKVTLAQVFKGSIALIGGIFDADWYYPTKRLLITQVAGFLLLFPIGWLFVKTLFLRLNGWLTDYKNKAYRTDFFLALCMVFVLGTILGIVVSRMGYGIYVFLTGKYKIYSILWLIISLLFLQKALTFRYKNWLSVIALVLSIALWENGYLNDFQFVRHQQIERMGELANWRLEAQAKGTQLETYPYNPPTVSVIDSLRFDEAIPKPTLIDGIELLPDGLLFMEDSISLINKNVYLVLRSSKQHFIYPVVPVRNKSRLGIFKRYFQDGFELEISNAGMPTELYQLYILEKKGNTQILYDTEKIVRIEGTEKIEKPEIKKNW